MLSAIWAAVKTAALAFAWWKQKSDQDIGRKLQSGEEAESNIKVKDVQLSASVDRPRDRDDLIERLRKHEGSD